MQHIQEIGRQHPYAASVSPMNNQQNFSRPPIVGQQNLMDSQMHSAPQSLLSPVQSVNHSQITNPSTISAPSSQLSSPLPMSPHGHGQSSADYQTQMANPPNTSLSQSGIGLYNSVPPTQAVTNLTSSTNPTGLSQFESRQFAPPLSTMGQLVANPPGTSLPQVRQKQYLHTAPPILGQTVTNPAGPGVPQSGQRQYSSTAPPLPGQILSGPLTMNRVSSNTTSNYQQPTYQQPGYHNQMVQL